MVFIKACKSCDYWYQSALREVFSPEDIRRSGTLHTTNKAFDRYLQIKTDDARRVYKTAINLTKRKKKEKQIEIVK